MEVNAVYLSHSLECNEMFVCSECRIWQSAFLFLYSSWVLHQCNEVRWHDLQNSAYLQKLPIIVIIILKNHIILCSRECASFAFAVCIYCAPFEHALFFSWPLGSHLCFAIDAFRPKPFADWKIFSIKPFQCATGLKFYGILECNAWHWWLLWFDHDFSLLKPQSQDDMAFFLHFCIIFI